MNRQSKLDLREQRTLHEVTDRVSRRGGSRTRRTKDGKTFVAERCGEFPFFRTQWRVIDAAGQVIAEGDY